MLRAKDLMIGDWINVPAAENIVQPDILSLLSKRGKVVGIDGDCVYVDFVEYPFMFGDIEPIPLTPEILEKNFEFLYRSVPGGIYAAAQAVDTYRAGGVTINYVHLYQYVEILNIRYVVFRYVHELQHALKLCGIDETIEL